MIEKLLHKIRRYELVVGLMCIITPFMLYYVEGCMLHSISFYAYGEFSYVYVFLLTFVSAVVLSNGFLKSNYYNICIGFSLVGVVLTPVHDHPISHYIFAGLFFLCNVISIVVKERKERFHYRVMQSTVLSVVLILGALNLISLFIAEAAVMCVIGFNYLAGLPMNKCKDKLL